MGSHFCLWQPMPLFSAAPFFFLQQVPHHPSLKPYLPVRGLLSNSGTATQPETHAWFEPGKPMSPGTSAEAHGKALSSVETQECLLEARFFFSATCAPPADTPTLLSPQEPPVLFGVPITGLKGTVGSIQGPQGAHSPALWLTGRHFRSW